MRTESMPILLLCALYLLVGTIGHDPWRGDDIAHFGPVFELFDGGQRLLPAIAGETGTGFGPLFYWFAAAIASLLQGLIPIHDGARLATALLFGSALWALWRAADLMHGRQARAAAVLLTLGSLGLVVHVHEIQPAIGLLAAQAWVLLMRVSRAPAAALGAGLAAGAAFLFAGLEGALMTWPLLLVPTPAAASRDHPWLQGWGALLVAVALAFAWALPASREAGWTTWLEAEFTGLVPELASPARTLDWFKLFGWFLWPLWPLAAWSLWRRARGAAIQHVPMLLAALLLALAAVLLEGGLRPMRMLPLIVPLALLAAPAVERLRRGAAAAFDWFAVMTFSSVGLLLWLAWSALVLHWPPGLDRHFRKLAPDFELAPGVPALVLGSVLVVAWVLYLGWRRPGGRDAALTWAAGMTMLWCTAASMLQPWFDHHRSYREAGSEFARALQGREGECVAGVGVGAAQRAAMHYHAGVRVRSQASQADCPLVLVYANVRSSARDLSRYGEIELWHYQRGGGRQRESFTLRARN